jgi:hypothetical protein
MATALKKTDTLDVPTPTNDATAIINMIDRMSARPDIPVERVEQLFALYQKMTADAARRAYFAALAEMQPTLPTVGRKGKSNNGKFARWEDIVEGIMPALKAHGFAVSFKTASTDKLITVIAILSHRDGHSEETSLTLPADMSGSKNHIQAIGSTTSYGKRYTASALLNIVSRGEDDDANALTTVTTPQIAALRDLIERSGSDMTRFLAAAGAETLDDVLAKDFPRLEAMLKRKLNP